MTKIKLSEFDQGYWCAVQQVLSLNIKPDRQTAEQLIRESGLSRITCLALIKNSNFNGNILTEIVNTIYP